MLNVAIVDYGLGNLFSVKQACERVGHLPLISSQAEDLQHADLVILPGVGAYSDAMNALRELGLVAPIRELAHAGKPIIGICLGLQLLMERSYEFGVHEGLGLLAGEVVRFPEVNRGSPLRVPHLCWNRVCAARGGAFAPESPLTGLPDGVFMYFVHSYYVRPVDEALVQSRTTYGGVQFCSSVLCGQIFGCQFHPERSGAQGLAFYRNLARFARSNRKEFQDVL